MNKLITTFVAVGIIGLAGCAAEGDDIIIEDPVLEETTPPVVTEPVTPPLGVDAEVDPAAPVDTLAPAAEPM